MKSTRSSGKARASGIASARRFRSFMRALRPTRCWRGSNLRMSDRKNVFLTGATGFLGSHLMGRLLHDGHHVTALARSSKNASAKCRVDEVLRDVGVTRIKNLRVLERDISVPQRASRDAAQTQDTSRQLYQ